MYTEAHPASHRTPWNMGKIIGQKAPFRLREIWAIRIRLQLAHRKRDLALFNLGHRQQHSIPESFARG
jgi:hypothetical protein